MDERNVLNYIVVFSILILLIALVDTFKLQLNNLFSKIGCQFNMIANKMVIYMIKILSKLELKIEKTKNADNSLDIEDLTPNIKNLDDNLQVKIYLDALKYAVGNPHVINIAVTGGFGTGKSTIINEFCKENRGNEYLHISLANFNNENKDNERLIETSIVQQILYYEKKAKIRESTYKRIDFTKPSTKIISILILTLWLYSLVFLFFKGINKKIILFNNYGTNITLIIIVFILGLIYIFYNSYDKIRNIKFSKMTTSSLELVSELQDKDLSVFNRSIDEILYFFEKTNTNVVLIEDIDRFDDEMSIKLYSKIREISILINQAKDISQSVKFIYAVKDELILEDKTKFFDIIIPVIPIIDYSNSKNMFLKKLSAYIESDEDFFSENEKISSNNAIVLDRNFISEVSNYVFDMRTVTNICNEFKLYNKLQIIDKPNIDKNKLFAIILYKNVFPDDFAKIQKNNSKLQEIFTRDFSKHKELSSLLSEIDENIEQITNEKEIFKKLLNNNLVVAKKDLRIVYIYELINFITEKQGQKCTAIEGIEIGLDLFSDENFTKISNSLDIKYDNTYQHNRSSGISFNDLEKRVNSDLNYCEREKLTIEHFNNILLNLEVSLRNLYSEKEKVKNLSIVELSRKYNKKIDTFLEFIFRLESDAELEKSVFLINKPTNFGLFKFLIENDYINEDFIEYVSYFHKGSLSSNDHNLMIKINQNNSTSFEEKITNVQKLVENVRDIRFKNAAALNYNIFYFLLNNSAISPLTRRKLDFTLLQLRNFDEVTISFLEGFIQETKRKERSLLNFYLEITLWEDFWKLVDTKFNTNYREEILLDLLGIFSENPELKITSLNNENLLSDYISNSKTLLQNSYKVIPTSKLISFFKLLEVKFKSISSSNVELLLDLYKNDLYQLNIDNITIFAKTDTAYNFDETKFLSLNYSFLRTQQRTSLFNRINADLPQYIESVYLNLPANDKNDISDVLHLLKENDEVISFDSKIRIIHKGFQGTLSMFPRIFPVEFMELFLEKNQVAADWENIELYYQQVTSFSPILSDFINIEENYEILSAEQIVVDNVKIFGEGEEYLHFLNELVNCSEISEIAFRSIFERSEKFNLDPSKIRSVGRLKYLIEIKLVEFNQENFKFLEKTENENITIYIESNENEFFENLSSYNVTLSTLQLLLHSKISTDNLQLVLDQKNSEILSSDLKFLASLSEFYLKRQIKDFKNDIFQYFLTSELSEETKINLFNLYFDTMGEDQISENLKKLGEQFIRIANCEEAELPDKEPYLILIKNLKEKKLIKRTYSLKGDHLKIAYYTNS